jgi:hypothetical protein
MAFFMIGIYGSKFGLGNLFGTRSRMEIEVWNNLVESWSRAYEYVKMNDSRR